MILELIKRRLEVGVLMVISIFVCGGLGGWLSCLVIFVGLCRGGRGRKVIGVVLR